MLISVDTSSKACSCALTEGDKLVAENYLNCGLTHSATLTVLIEDMLSAAKIGFDKIDGIAVNVGPGSYTGLRIGLAAVKGMATAKNIPCAGVSTLLSLAYNLLPFEGIVCAALDARVGQVFAALFEIKNGKVKRLTEDMATTLEELEKLLPEKAMVCGDGTELVCKRFPQKELIPAPTALRYQRASSVASAAAAEMIPMMPAEKLEAAYHRKSQAEREREVKTKA